MKEFFKTVRDSIWGPQFYAVMDSRSVRQAARYLLSLSLFVSFITVVYVSFALVPAGLSAATTFSNLLVSKYPPGLVLNFNGGIASTTEARAYIMPLPREIYDQADLNKLRQLGLENLLVIDTRTDFDSIGQWRAARSLVLLTRNAAVSRNDNGGFGVSPVPKDLKVTVTKELAVLWASKIVPLARILIPLLVAFGFAASLIGNFVFYFIISLVAALIIWLVSLIMKRSSAYKQCLVISLYAVTLTALFDLVMFLLNFQIGNSISRAVVLVLLVWILNVKLWAKPNLPVTSSGTNVPEVKP